MQRWLRASPFIMQAKLSHLPSGLHCCEKVTASRQSEAGKRRGRPNVIRTSYRSTQTKRYSCNFGAAVQQSAGNVGGFNKKWVSLCAQLDFLSVYADCTAQNKLVHRQYVTDCSQISRTGQRNRTRNLLKRL